MDFNFISYLVVLIAIECAKGADLDEAVVCEPPWQLLHRSCVQFIKTMPFKSWQEARDYCSSINADLFSINDKAEKDSIEPILKEHVKSKDLLLWWVGLKLSENGTWYWVDKEEFNKNLIDWEKIPSTVPGNVRCGMLTYQGIFLKDEDCNATKPFICEQIKATKHQPSFKDTDTNVTAVIGNKVQLPCSIQNLSDPYEVSWIGPDNSTLTVNETVLSADARFSMNFSAPYDWNLVISRAFDTDAGKYLCVVNTEPRLFREVRLHFKYDKSDADDTFDLLTKIVPMTEIVPTDVTPPLLVEGTTGMSKRLNQSSTSDPFKCSSSRPCDNDGECINSTGVCNCLKNFTGRFCETSLTCPPGACNINNTHNCTVVIEQDSPRFVCRCLAFYEGPQCDVYNTCISYPCKNDGRCKLQRQDSSGDYTCACIKGDPNKDCLLNEKNECLNSPPNKADSYITCNDRIGSADMICAPGYYGIGCLKTEDKSLFCQRYGQNYCRDEGYCKPLCNVEICNGTLNCQFTSDPYNTTGFDQNPSCNRSFADGYDHVDCHNESTLFDGFDQVLSRLDDCSPYFDTICTRDFGNDECKPECNNEACLWDGFDCARNESEPLPGIIVVELLQPLPALAELQKNISLMLRSRINISLDDSDVNNLLMSGANNMATNPILTVKISHTNFTSVVFAGKFLAAAVAKRPFWLDTIKVKVTDIFACEAGSYSTEYSNKCNKTCDTCLQEGEVCDWRTGVCYACPPGHWGSTCIPCNGCIQNGDVCEWSTGECLYGCNPGHWGYNCQPCDTCKDNNCNNRTGVCLNGCRSNLFFGPTCKQCSQNCVGGCNYITGYCNNCPSNRFGHQCDNTCDAKCDGNTCNRETGACECDFGASWSEGVVGGCCNVSSASCTCKPGYYGQTCSNTCQNCLNASCISSNGTCVSGCRDGFHGDMCTMACPVNCFTCSRRTGVCENCNKGFEGNNCEKNSGQSGYIESATDHTGIIIGVAISVIIIVLIIVIACCYWKRRQSGDYYMEDEEEDMTTKHQTIQVHNNTHMQPAGYGASLGAGISMDMIELDDKPEIAVYAGPGRDQRPETEPLLHAADDTPKAGENTDVDEPSPKVSGQQGPSEGRPQPEGQDGETIPESSYRHKSSVVIEVGSNGRVLSISDGEELHSPTLPKEGDKPIGEEEEGEDDNAFQDADTPPHSPLGEARAPLASEENILASLGPAKFGKKVEPVDKEDTDEEEEPSDEDNRSPSSRSSSSSSPRSSSSEDENNTAQM